MNIAVLLVTLFSESYASFGRIGRFVSGAVRCRGYNVQGFDEKYLATAGRREEFLPNRKARPYTPVKTS